MKYEIPAEIKVTRVRECVNTGIADDVPSVIKYWNANIATSQWFSDDKEHAVTILLDARLRPIGHNLVSIGSVSEAIVQPREVFRPAIVSAAYAIVLLHNHPSGDPSPSQADYRVTRRIKEAADIMGIALIDHIIVGDERMRQNDAPGYFSFKESGII
jgi:DNA repair protein RadC